MCKSLVFSLFFSAATLVIPSCGQIGGNNVTGVTGGTANSEFDERFLGRWSYYSPYEMTIVYLTFYPDGSCQYNIHRIEPESTVEGTWQADGIRYRFDIAFFWPSSGIYTVSARKLTLMSCNIIWRWDRVIE